MTVRVADPVTPPMVAVIFVVPDPALDATPLLLTTAAAGFEEFQPTERVMFCAVPSLKIPVAVKFWLLPKVIAVFDGVIAMETNVALLTFRVAELTIEFSTAPITVVPGAIPVASPMDPAALIVATVKSEDVQWTDEVSLRVDPSL